MSHYGDRKSAPRKLTVRQIVARSYPGWDYEMADRFLAWLDECGYEIVEKRISKPEQRGS
ncbi:hypothetical protein [Bradyrhizobium sp. SZCCHNRI3037]|uniref:hypothetical protein n=1 Tax=Bradyrhizobium sp. SZCCHNRI3037 TaxID=3057290 RepID=UPI002916DD05|nr:hypothetical protein [Bradyrhizobium sp. SZCCHNRI3037]